MHCNIEFIYILLQRRYRRLKINIARGIRRSVNEGVFVKVMYGVDFVCVIKFREYLARKKCSQNYS